MQNGVFSRYLLEGAGGVFTGSRYKDLQIQSLGLWGEIRDWREGSTIVQKTHDADDRHVLEVSNRLDFASMHSLWVKWDRL